MERPASRAVTPRLITSGEPTEFTREGVTVWRAGQEPWRPVKRLVVLGFAQDQYPAALGRNAVFSAEDLDGIRDMHGTAVDTPADGARAPARAVPAAARCGQRGGDVSGAAARCDRQGAEPLREPGVHAPAV